MEVMIIRHAEPDYGKDTVTENGRQEAKALGLSLKESGLDDLYVSPLGRAQETCRYIAEALNINPVTLDWLREIQLDVDLGYAPGIFQVMITCPEVIYLLQTSGGRGLRSENICGPIS